MILFKNFRIQHSQLKLKSGVELKQLRYDEDIRKIARAHLYLSLADTGVPLTFN